MKTLDWSRYLEKAIQVASEGIVMLENDNNALPLDKDKPVAVFGRIQLHYYKSGTGSGGMVNVSKVTGITDGLIEADVKIDTELLDIYKKWDVLNPYDMGTGWGNEPWSQVEMPLDDEIVKKSAEKCDTAIIIIGRTAGEEQDSKVEESSYLLTETENNMIEKVRRIFKKVVILLNVGGIIDMSFVDRYKPDSVLYVWQGGMTGGTGVANVLTGKTSPCGKLPDTIAYSVSDYPSDKNFGGKERNFYCEDIYIGYRWFETFAPEKVRYPFGYGLSYTDFEIIPEKAVFNENSAVFSIKVTNTGSYSGKEVVQLYCRQPQGTLGKPDKVLCGFAKTKTLAPSENQILEIAINYYDISSYDDSSVTGNKFCWVLESGKYTFLAGNSIRNLTTAGTLEKSETEVLYQCVQAMPPVTEFKRIKAVKTENGYISENKNVPLIEYDENKRRIENLPAEISYTGDKGIKLSDVKNDTHSMEEFIAQFSDYDLSCIIRGEGMGSPRVTAGTASAFGGVSDSLVNFGIPAGCCSDGPSGMRLDCGTKAFSLPNGTMIASTFNRELLTELFELLGLEMSANKVDCLLGPGMNIHRHVLNGRNFEYFSEDPFLTGHMATAELNGLHKSGVTGTIKHFCGNNQETNRHNIDSIVSERALREIYLKGFEIAVKSGNAESIMTTYGAVNGIWTAGNFDLNTTILRNEWGFKGITMTDWWANINSRGTAPDKNDFASMVKAQNDLYMVCADGSSGDDNTLEELEKGNVFRCELQRNAMNICNFLINTHAMERLIGTKETVKIINRPDSDGENDTPVVFYEVDGALTLDLSDVKAEKGSNYSFALTVNKSGFYEVKITASSNQSETAQIPVTIFAMGTASGTFTWNGTNGQPVSYSKEIPMFSRFTAIRLYFAQSGLDLKSIEFKLTREAQSLEEVAFRQED
ncbi:MAG: glycoside hydrolase family 3 C-terminal domain-containing protein [Muribaculaceae bacterium]|nr:glycoside hydrolase family 3 C-terminal domain-containing protein [Alistipes senegalensis]MCM1473328.1 glycoside hydrolase family 3 C-terminal domain-containing protein [Muribaculaceae bacterium]